MIPSPLKSSAKGDLKLRKTGAVDMLTGTPNSSPTQSSLPRPHTYIYICIQMYPSKKEIGVIMMTKNDVTGKIRTSPQIMENQME